MKTKKNLRRKPLSIKSKFFLFYTAAFLLCAAGCYCWFLIKGKSLIVDSDGWRQHFAAFIYLGQYGRQAIRTLLSTHTWVLPQWDFSIGLGGDILTTLHFYAIGDPLDLLSIACPTRYAAYLYSFLSLFRLYLSGLTFGAFCFVKKQRSIGGVTIGALVYVFTLYSFFIVSHHPFFALPMVFLPLLLLGVEQILAGKRPYLFIFLVFLASISNFYFFYMLAILTALYTVYQLILHFRHRAGAAFAAFFKIAGCAVLGVALSAVILLPVVLAFMGDNRSAESYAHTWIYSANYYRNLLGSMFTSGTKMGYLTYFGYNAVAFPAICLLFFTKSKQYRPLRVLFLFATLLLLIPAFGWMMNGFSYVANRWIWAYGMIVAYIVAVTWRQLRQISFGKGVAVICALAVYSLFAIPLMNTDTRNIGVSVLLAFLLVIVSVFAPKMPKKFLAPVLSFALIFTSFAGNAAYFYCHHGENHIARYVSYSSVNSKLKSSPARKVKRTAKDDDTFFRYTGDTVNYNEALTAGMNGTSFYWSMQNKHMAQFVTETEQPANAAYMLRGLNHSAAMNAVTGVKYYTKEDKTALPYGFTKIGSKLYENQNNLPFGYTTSKVITQANYDKLSALEKQQALLQGVVLEQVPTAMTAATPTFTDTCVPYTLAGNDYAAVEGQKLHIYKKNGKVTLQMNGSPGQETYLRFTLKDYTDYPDYTYYKTQQNDPLHKYSTEKWNALDELDQNLIKIHAGKFRLANGMDLKISAKTEDGKTYNANTITCYSRAYVRYTGPKTYLVNLGYTDCAKKSITISFNTRGIYDFADIEVLEQPVDRVHQQIADLRTDTLQNVKMESNTIDGTISLKEAKVLLLTIPYSEGWAATVDGNPAELLQANTMFSALALEPGEHTIHLSYRTPHLRTGAYLSAAGAVAFATVIICTECQIKKKKSAGTD